MGSTAMTIATLMYVITSWDLFRKGDVAFGVVYAAYTVANCAMMWGTPSIKRDLLHLAVRFA